MSEAGIPATAGAEAEAIRLFKERMQRVVSGQTAVIDQMLITLLCGGHALLEGVPGTAKTLMVKVMAKLLQSSFKRIQFTPDLMPSDITGTHVFNLRENAFELKQGPIFTDFLLADEINRAPAKTQSALLEAMQERQVTIGDQTLKLSPLFTVFATQNPIEYEGTYQLPEAQLDRFLLKINVDYPSMAEEMAVISSYDRGERLDVIEALQLETVFTHDAILRMRQQVYAVRVDDAVKSYILEIVRQTRKSDAFFVGASVRASISLLLAAKARAYLQGRNFVIPDDVVAEVPPTLNHRVILRAESEIEGVTKSEALRNILDKIDVPR